MYPHSFEEEFGNFLCYDTLLAHRQYRHLRKSIHNQKYTSITLLGGREPKQIVHANGFPWLAGSRHRSVQSLLLDGWFCNGTNNAGSNIFSNILSEYWPIKILLRYFHSFLHTKVSCDPTVMHLLNHLGMLG